MTHICVRKLTNIGSNNGLSPGRRQAIIWTNAAILLIGPLGTNFSEFLIVIHTCSFNKMHLKMSSAKWHPFCLGLNVLKCQEVQVSTWPCFYQTGSTWPMDQGSARERSTVCNWANTVTELGDMAKAPTCHCRDRIDDRRVILLWILDPWIELI